MSDFELINVTAMGCGQYRVSGRYESGGGFFADLETVNGVELEVIETNFDGGFEELEAAATQAIHDAF